MSHVKKAFEQTASLLAATLLLHALPALAQTQHGAGFRPTNGNLTQRGGDGMPDDRQGPPPMDGGFGGPGVRNGGPPPMNVVHMPLALLASELNLTVDQKTRIGRLQESARPPHRDRNGFNGGPPPDGGRQGGPQARLASDRNSSEQGQHIGQDMRQRMGHPPMHDEQTEKQINAILTAGQRSALPDVLKRAEGIHAAGIPLEIYPTLNLSARQKSQIFALPAPTRTGDRTKDEAARRSRREKTMTLLTPAQRKAIDAFRQSHPRPGPPPDGFGGGPGGFGEPGGGGRGDGPPQRFPMLAH